MLLYDIEYICPLTPTQQEHLAIALTNLHAQRFHAPSCFFNVRYTDAQQPDSLPGRRAPALQPDYRADSRWR